MEEIASSRYIQWQENKLSSRSTVQIHSWIWCFAAGTISTMSKYSKTESPRCWEVAGGWGDPSSAVSTATAGLELPELCSCPTGTGVWTGLLLRPARLGRGAWKNQPGLLHSPDSWHDPGSPFVGSKSTERQPAQTQAGERCSLTRWNISKETLESGHRSQKPRSRWLCPHCTWLGWLWGPGTWLLCQPVLLYPPVPRPFCDLINAH